MIGYYWSIRTPARSYAGKWLVQRMIKSKMVRMLVLAFTTTACTGAHDHSRREAITRSAVVAGSERCSLYFHGWIFNSLPNL